MSRWLTSTACAGLATLALASTTLAEAGGGVRERGRVAEIAPIAVGDRAPDFTLPGSDGKAYHLASLRGKKAVALVFFRGTW